jgi:hypothetical protein
VDRMLSTGDLSTPEGRARAAEHALAAVAEHPDDLVRDQYVMQLADRCRLDVTKLRERLDHVRAHPPQTDNGSRKSKFRRDEEPPRNYPDDDAYDIDGPDGAAAGGPPLTFRPGPGLEALKLAVHRPDEVVERVHPVLFFDPVQRQAFVALEEHDSVHEAVEAAPPQVAGLLRRVTVEEPMAGDPDLGDPVHSVVSVLVREAVRRALADVGIESRAEGASWQDRAAETAQVRLWLDQLDDPDAGRDAADRLVAWLDGRDVEE